MRAHACPLLSLLYRLFLLLRLSEGRLLGLIGIRNPFNLQRSKLTSARVLGGGRGGGSRQTGNISPLGPARFCVRPPLLPLPSSPLRPLGRRSPPGLSVTTFGTSRARSEERLFRLFKKKKRLLSESLALRRPMTTSPGELGFWWFGISFFHHLFFPFLCSSSQGLCKAEIDPKHHTVTQLLIGWMRGIKRI